MELCIVIAWFCQNQHSECSLDMRAGAVFCSAIGIASVWMSFISCLHVVTCPLWTRGGLHVVHGIHLPIYSDHDQALYKSNSIGTAMQ